MDYVVGKPQILNQDLFKKRVEDILYTNQYSNIGKYTQEVEDVIKEILHVNHAVAVNNATSGLEICLAYIKTKVSKTQTQVVIPSFTFVATAHAVIRAGFTPVFCDILNDFTLDIDDLDNKVCSKTAAIMPVNLFGNLNPVDILTKYRDLHVVYDSAHAFNMVDDITTRYVGGFGNAEVFSFHPTKICGGMEYGVITTNDQDLADFARRYRNFGFDPAAGPHGECVSIGMNAKPNEIQSAAILCQMENIVDICEHYFQNYLIYKNNLPSSVVFCEPNVEFSNYSYIIIRSKHRDKLWQYLYDNGVFARIYFQPIHKMKPYFKVKESLPNTELISSEVLALPTGTHISPDCILFICNLISKFSEIESSC